MEVVAIIVTVGVCWAMLLACPLAIIFLIWEEFKRE